MATRSRFSLRRTLPCSPTSARKNSSASAATAPRKDRASPSDVRLYDVDVLPSGGAHATAARVSDAGTALVGWIGLTGNSSRTLDMPHETEGEQPRLLHGGASFIATVDGKGMWIGEREDQLVVKKSNPFTSASAGPAGDVWFAERDSNGHPRVRNAHIDFADDAPIDSAIVPLPSAGDLAAAGASPACQDLGFIDTIVAATDGTVWLSVNCATDGRAILRGVPTP